tara:strand:- start:180 stop:518 length:339 start_codon:yes stop_codon:yes gene_type:complete
MTKKIKKPWGYEQLVEKNKKYLVKLLYMKKKHRCSLQYHRKKIETVIVLNGKLKVTYHDKKKIKNVILTQNKSITIKAKTIHRMQGITNCLYLEASTPQNYDVVRLEDDYNR